MSKLTKPKSGPSKSARRREELRRIIPRPSFNLLAVVQKPEFISTALVLIAFLMMVSVTVAWSRDQVKVRDGQIMTDTQLKRLDYRVQDADATQAKREEARKSSPRIYKPNTSYLARLQTALLGLPKAVAGINSVDQINPDVRKELDLTESDLHALQSVIKNGDASPEWTGWVNRLVQEELLRNPLLRSTENQFFILTLHKALLRNGELQPIRGDAIELKSDPATPPDPRLRELVLNARFPNDLVPVVLKRLTWDPQPTILYSEEETNRLAREAVAAVPPEMVEHHRGEVLYREGDVLTPEQYSDVLTEATEFRARAPFLARWQNRFGAIGLIAIISLFLGVFASSSYPRIVRNPLRIAAICALMAILLATTALITAYAPIFLLPAAIGPTLIVAIVLLVAYDQRLSLLLSGIQCILVTLALSQSIGFFVLLLAGCATMIANLREVRNRNSLLRAATATAAVMGAGTILLGLLEIPLVAGALQQIMIMSFSAIGTSYGVAFLVLGILPSIEKLFDITTGMTLAELRDPKRPLLRQLQQRAPGTYNHSLQVANIAEAAAEAIGADGLLVYVGALYHDIGKINKPEYFVENQSGGQNKHEKLSPAMSLLVIIGHVKNGVELAREYGLPRQIIHFIESHHGSTLVEYFYHAAKAKSELTDAGPSVAEVEYRYPGPKPQTKEAAILMLSDAVESSTRALAEPTPSRIENLVRKLSQKRLEDGQFDQCDLTFKELAMIEDAIINRMMAIYHSRISYPSTSGKSGEQSDAPISPPRPASAKPVSA